MKKLNNILNKALSLTFESQDSAFRTWYVRHKEDLHGKFDNKNNNRQLRS